MPFCVHWGQCVLTDRDHRCITGSPAADVTSMLFLSRFILHTVYCPFFLICHVLPHPLGFVILGQRCRCVLRGCTSLGSHASWLCQGCAVLFPSSVSWRLGFPCGATSWDWLAESGHHCRARHSALAIRACADFCRLASTIWSCAHTCISLDLVQSLLLLRCFQVVSTFACCGTSLSLDLVALTSNDISFLVSGRGGSHQFSHRLIIVF